MNKSFLDNKTTTYKEQYYQGGRSYGKTFYQNRIKQAYKSGLDAGFIEKYKLIKYLEDKIKTIKKEIEHFDIWHEVGVDLNFLILQKQWCQDILEKVKSGKYE